MGGKVVYICKGSDCRRRAEEREQLEKCIGELRVVKPVRCQKICKGPVIGLRVDGRVEWFKSVRSKKLRGALAKLITDGTRDKRLFERRVKKRSGKFRR